MRFDWDEGNWPKCGKYGLSKEEIEYVPSNDPLIMPDRYPPELETRFNAVGQNENGGHVFLVFTLRGDGKCHVVRPISARYMHGQGDSAL
uniref:Uncharacterized protein n=1 Tax=Candidatus Kentrum sp. TC TaxID=2126339 RepID=A0A450YEW9_9GAMM|nr:MAG: hypothetical protein BECKTC1821E_GA0114239_100657 [Candidatus Kentron sp. TC]VFK55974.1 MAG: hypothetical protein BECKTC1821F_GA0114240_100858 [Candidatus Kentron sp. TC]